MIYAVCLSRPMTTADEDKLKITVECRWKRGNKPNYMTVQQRDIMRNPLRN